MRRLVVLLTVGASLAAVPAAGASGVITCGYIDASVPYSARGRGDRWRVYANGDASCATAVKVLDAIMHLSGKRHLGSDEANSYVTFDGWLCPSGDMGVQSCELPARPPDHPPIRAHALALNCGRAANGCPVRVPSQDL